jgi:hypothetical protein
VAEAVVCRRTFPHFSALDFVHLRGNECPAIPFQKDSLGLSLCWILGERTSEYTEVELHCYPITLAQLSARNLTRT